MKHLRTFVLLIASLVFANSIFAGDTSNGSFVKKSKSIRGDWSIVSQDGSRTLVLSENFKATSGPDLKIFLSPTEFSSVNGRNATKGSLLISELKRAKGAQTYVLPKDLDLSKFKSLLVHCEKYAVLWGGSPL